MTAQLPDQHRLLSFLQDGPGLRFDLDRLIGSRLLIEANSGGGKSHALRQLLEETHGRVQQLVIDPEGEFASLRERFDYVYAAGKGGDVLASVKTAGLLCRRLVELGVSAVVDLYDLSLPDRKKFVRLFLTELMALERSLWRPLLVVLDEAHVFAPESGHGESEALGAVVALTSQGRKRGFCAVLATQRIGKLAKDAAADLNNKLVGRHAMDTDVKRAGDDLGFDREGRARLKSLEPGEFYAVGPAVSPTVQLVRTGKVRTSHPEAGKVTAAPPPPPAKVRALLAQLADLPQQAEERERTVQGLEGEVRRLKAELARKPAPPAPVEKRVDVPVITDRQAAQLERAAEKALQMLAQLEKVAQDVLAPIRAAAASKILSGDKGGAARGSTPGRTAVPDRAPRTAAAVRPAPPPAPRAGAGGGGMLPPPPASPGEVKVKKGARAMLVALASRHPEPLTRHQVGTLAGLTSSSGTFSDYLSALRRAGYVEEDRVLSGTVAITDAGLALVGDVEQPATSQDLLALWAPRFKRGARAMLTALVQCHPAGLSREDLGQAAGAFGGEALSARSGTFSDYLSALRRNGLIEERGGLVHASGALFPEEARAA